MDMALFDSFILYSNNTDKPVSRKKYMKEIVMALAKDSDGNPPTPRVQPGQPENHQLHTYLGIKQESVQFVTREATGGVKLAIVEFILNATHS